MLTSKGMAEAMYAMDILAAKLGGAKGNRLDWIIETGLPGAPLHPADSQTAVYERWLAAKPDEREAFRNLVSTFVFLLARKAFGQSEALDSFVCAEEVFW